MLHSPQFLQELAQSALSRGDLQRVMALCQELRFLQPESVENLLHIMLLAMHGEGLSMDFFLELDLLTQIAMAVQLRSKVDELLVLQALEKFLDEPFLDMVTADFVAACGTLIGDREQFVEVVFPAAVQLGYGRGWYGLSAALVDVCLELSPKNKRLLAQLPLLCQKAGIYERGVSAARDYLKEASTEIERLNGSYMLLRGLLNRGGGWEEAMAMLPAHRVTLEQVIMANLVMSRADSRRLLPMAYLLPYLEDLPVQNHRLQNRLIAVSERSMQTYARAVYDRYQASHRSRRTAPRPQKLKVGYLCHCFHGHSVGWLARWLLKYHDLGQIELYAYSLNDPMKGDYIQDQYREIVTHFRDCGFDGLEIAEQIHRDGIDILVDMDSLTLDVTCEVVALKPAPIQVTWLGWDASGFSTIDYYLADRYVLPEKAQDYYVEEIWRLPTAYLVVDGFEVGEADLTRALLDIPEDAVVYYSGQRGFKRHRDTTLWQLQIIAQVPNAIFLVKGLADEDAIKVFFYDLADEVGLDRNRLRFAPQASSEEIHRANLAIADVVLDTFPYNGATTTMEALWMERPLVTLVGEQFAARNSYTMLVNAGVEEGIAWSPEEYIEWGVRLGKDAALRTSVVEKLRQSKVNKAPLWNGKQFAQDIEVAYQEMARRFWTEDEAAVQARIDRHALARKNDIADPVVAMAVLILVNWQQPEEELEQFLYEMFDCIIASPIEHRFFIDTTGTDEETAALILGGALMSFLMRQGDDVAQEPDITLIAPLDVKGLERFTTQSFHCAKLLCGDVTLASNVAADLEKMADYCDDMTYQISKLAQPTLVGWGKIIVDGAFYQLYNTGIGRLWQSLLEEWAKNGFGNNIVVLDRAGSAPKVSGISYRTLPRCDYENPEAEQDFLQAICDEENAGLFISTYYTMPRSTPSIFMGYDMIPEVLGCDLSGPIWRRKHDAIRQAVGHITISQNTASDLYIYFPEINQAEISPILCGVSDDFSPANGSEISQFRAKYNIHKPYFLLVGAGFGYKNSQLFLDGLSQFSSYQDFDVVCTGASAIEFSEEARKRLPTVQFLPFFLEDREFRSAYSGAVALVYPSKYEGFGLPIVEAMKCGCPVITCPNASIPEVAGDAAIYVGDSDVEAMAEALLEVQKPQVRDRLVQTGYQQAAKFSWKLMAEQMQEVLLGYLHRQPSLEQLLVLVDWHQPEADLHGHWMTFFDNISGNVSTCQFLVDISGIDAEFASMIIGGVMMDYLMTSAMADEPQIEFVDLTAESSLADFTAMTRIELGEVSPKLKALFQASQQS